MIVATPTGLGKVSSPVELTQQLQEYVKEAAAEAKPLHEAEQHIFDSVLKIGFAVIEQFLKAQGDGDLGPTVTTENGQNLQRSDKPKDRLLRTVFGLHTIHAYAYAPAPHKKIALWPIDARLQLPPGRASYLFEEFSQYFCVEQAFGQSAGGIKTVLRQKVPVDSLERINQRLGEQAEEFLEQLPTPPPEEEGELLVFTGDGKGVPIVTEDLKALAAFEETPDRPGNRRMAVLAGVYSVDRYVRTPDEIVAALFREGERPRGQKRPKPQFKHLRACFAKTYDADTDQPTVVSGAFEAFAWAAKEVESRVRPEQPLLRLFDGQTSLVNVSDACLTSVEHPTIDILDILHVSQYVWRAAKVFHKTTEHQEAFARDRLLRILRGEVQGVILGLRQMASKRKLSRKRRRKIDTVCGYFSNNAYRMRYDEYLREGYPIATGVIEGACRHLVKDRMERSGMRWRLDSAQAMLNVRAVFLSTYWQDFHAWRIDCEQSQIHPHRNLLSTYTPCTSPGTDYYGFFAAKCRG